MLTAIAVRTRTAIGASAPGASQGTTSRLLNSSEHVSTKRFLQSADKKLASAHKILAFDEDLRQKAKKPLDAKATRDVVSDYLTWQVVLNGGYSILEALDLEAKYQISFWDALIVQAAHVSGAEVLYSEDLSEGQAYGAVRVVNPFRAGA